MFEVVIKILSVLSIPVILWNIYLHRQNKKLTHLDAERQLTIKRTELERVQARHEQERRDLLADCEGEIRVRENMTADYLTVEDHRRLDEQYAEHRRQIDDLYTDISYYEKILGRNFDFLGENSSWYKRIWLYVKSKLLSLRK